MTVSTPPSGAAAASGASGGANSSGNLGGTSDDGPFAGPLVLAPSQASWTPPRPLR